jgi:16S rRNA (guanine966-N2)-methyltransferase|tara:strand:- start:6658 stop:7194 length:537 start_codon:yes stop_codon:yes gene_type:complete
VRIISGKYKGKRLMAPKKLPVRPTTDFAKEALFNILTHRVDFEETSLLDLFSGTGNISYEFGSRGTEDITSVDTHYGCVKYINTISEELDFSIKTVKSDVLKYLSSTPFTFDVIFADPPYSLKQSEFEAIVNKIFERELLNDEGFLIVEHSKHTDLSKNEYFKEARRYGGSIFSFFEI